MPRTFLDPWYVVGFTDADGTFPVIIHLKLNKKGQRFIRVRALFSISQKKSEIYPKAPSRRHYTLDEKDFVRRNYLKLTDSMIAKKLDRTANAIACLRKDMRLLRI